ncbi:MAG: polysaccharide biosynthesis tyrosine autokinase [Deltaproteobacteria bacterium]|nr:polysaccharide biosynthesis tyrosine autokinase [Deltaproteobacteria bacterium]
MKELSPYSQERIVLLEPEDSLSNRRHGERGGDAPNLRDYWHVARKHQWKIMTCFAAAVAASAVIAFSVTPTYTAKATMLIERKDPQVVNFKQVLAEPIDAEENSYYESQYQILKSRSLAADVIKTLGLDRNPAFTNPGGDDNAVVQLWVKAVAWLKSFLPQTPAVESTDLAGVSSQLIDAYGGMLEVEPVKRSRLVKIAISAATPALAAQIANAHADAYIRQGFTLRNQANDEARRFLQTKLAELKGRVEQSEHALNDFRRQNGIISLDDKENIVVDRLADLNKRLTEAEAERIGLEAQARLIKQRQYDSLPAVLSHSLIQNLKAQVVQLEAEHAKLSAQFLPGYPKLAQVKAQMEESRSRLAQQIEDVVGGIGSAFFAAQGKERALRLQMEKQKAETLKLKDASVEYSILARQVDTNKQLYESVLGRFKEISVAAGIPTANVSIVDQAEVPRLPSKPQKKLNLMLGALLGLMGGLGLALIFEHLDNTLRTPEEVERYLGLPNLVVVPDFFSLPRGRWPWKSVTHHQRTLSLAGNTPSADHGRFSVINEAYRKLRTSIFLSRSETPPKTILFTSATAAEGKTMTAANTAIALAHQGSTVLLIDADLHRPSCHKALKVPGVTGLADYLASQEELYRAIKPTSIANLSVLNCGSVPPSPTELIGSRKMRDTLAHLKDDYDFLLIDSPPVMPVSDAVILSSLADAMIFVVEGQKTPKHLVRKAIAQLGNNQAKILGVVLNRVDIRGPEYREYYRYYNPQFYHHPGHRHEDTRTGGHRGETAWTLMSALGRRFK